MRRAGSEPPALPAPRGSSVTLAGMSTTVQCQKPEGVGASGSKQLTTNDWVSAGKPDQSQGGGEVVAARGVRPVDVNSDPTTCPSAMSGLLTVNEPTSGNNA